MPVTKTIEFLPAIFQTETNRKFLNATLDQLVAEPKLSRVNGYIGRKFSPSFKTGDSYIRELTSDRGNYQLEPSVVVKNQISGDTEFHVTYPEILQKLRYYGASTTNQQKFWESEYYTYNPHIDLDKFVNFGQYYWLPDGPDYIDVFAGEIDLEKTYNITATPSGSAFNIDGFYDIPNPDLVLARGGEYKFSVNRTGRKFWIQSAPGLSGKQSVLSNISSREVLGVTNNGAEVGEVTFVVPSITDQDFYINMPKVQTVDLATTEAYSNLQNRLMSEIEAEYGGIDGQYTPSILSGKYVIFAKPYYDDSFWTDSTTSEIVPADQRYGIWQIDMIETPIPGEYVVNLKYIQGLPTNNKVTVRTGTDYGGTDWFKNADGINEQIPAITANLDTLYYQDSEDSALVGVIRLVEPSGNEIDVSAEIIGKKKYVSPNGVVFSNGMKIKFDASVTPAEYQNSEYYVDGVGDSITLTLVESLGNTYSEPDYIVINRSSLDKSQWSCGNRWFHKDVVRQTAFYTNTVPVYDQITQAKRPIIEFAANLQLFDFGTTAKVPVDVYDDQTVFPFVAYEGARINSLTSSGVYIDGVEVFSGMRVIFASDQDPTTRNNIWVASFIQVGGTISSPYQLHFELATDGEVADGDTVLVKGGIRNINKNFWYYNSSWNEGQIKSSVNQAPLYDIYDVDGVSFGDQTKYPNSSVGENFVGTPIFSYAIGTGTNDTVLGFPLEYRTVNNIGDIVFTNFYDVDQFQYTIDNVNYTAKVNTGRLKQHYADGSFAYTNNWSTVSQPTTQFQNISYTYDGIYNSFYCDVTPKVETEYNTFMVYVNGKAISRDKVVISTTTNGMNVLIDQSLIAGGDKIDFLIDSEGVSSLGFYQLPVNLDRNAQNNPLGNITLGELRNHIQTVVTHATAFKGQCPGISNLRDLSLVNFPGTILQHSASVPAAAMFLCDTTANLVDAITYAAQEYARFKNRFLEISISNPDIALLTPADAIDEIMRQMNAVKTKMFPWFYSDMVPYGVEKNLIEYTVFNANLRSYEITEIFNPATPSSRAVLVYINGVQKLLGYDYIFSVESAAIEFLDAVTLQTNDLISIVEYHNTEGCYVPETPTKLGLYPKFTPVIYTDSTYRTPVSMIRGHDGSLTPAFGDFRDQLLLNLEKRIYNNIKVSYDQEHYGLANVVPGKFRSTGATATEFSALLGKSFMRWAGLNRLDYTSNATWQMDDGFTWNFAGIRDAVDGEILPGSWRACYQYYYDTQTPHLTPWEMLGFSEEPTWWQASYGPAPYTGGNAVLWGDLESGYIAGGDRQGIDLRFARPGLSAVIPVDVNGNLLPPVGILAKRYEAESTNRSWAVGAVGPVENAWQKSSDYPFALQIAMAVVSPANYFGLFANKQLVSYDKVVGQFLNQGTKQRLMQTEVVVNGETDTNGNTLYAAGYVNWISDLLRNLGIDPVVRIKSYLRDLDIRLSYRLAGFSDKKYLKVLAEQYSPESTNDSVLIPDSDYDLVLNKSTPVQKISYSAVVIEKTTTGFRVSGYNIDNPVFTIIPPEPGGDAYDISVLEQSVKVYKKFRKIKITVPYGYEFTTVQQVSNFLMGYGLYLASQGFKFDEYDELLEEVRNWNLSIKEFLFWTQQGWKASSVLVISPAASNIKVAYTSAVVDGIGNAIVGSRVLNQNFQAIGNQSLSVVRDRNQFSLYVTNQDTIGLIELDLVQYEHAMIFRNTTMFNDTIYRPELGLRQTRLKLVGFKTSEWTGNLDPQGFVYNIPDIDQWQSMRDYLKGDLVQYKGVNYTAKTDLPGSTEFNFTSWIKSTSTFNTGLLPNMAFNSTISESFYDVDSVNLESQYDQFGKALIGFKPRQYLDMLGVDDTTQVKFYQGFIHEKGAPNAFAALANVSFSGSSSTSVEVSEDWAFRVGEYGALDTAQTVDLELSDQEVLSNPFTVQVTNGESDSNVVVRQPYMSSDINFAAPIFLDREQQTPSINDISTAGFVNVEDIDLTVYELANYNNLNAQIDLIGSGTKIWCAKDFSYDWNVYRVSELTISVSSISNALDGFIVMNMNVPHGLSAGDIVLVKSVKEFSGFYKIDSVPSITSIIVDSGKTLTGFINYTDLSGPVFSMQSMRYDYSYQIAETMPKDGWKNTDIAWVKNNTASSWGVYKKETPWEFGRMLPVGDTEQTARLGASVNLSYDNNFALVGKPGSNSGVGELVVYAKSFSGQLVEQDALRPITDNASEFGSCLDQGMLVSVVGAPSSASNTGYAFVVNRTTMGRSSITQALVANDYAAGDQFGAAVAISQDDQWIYVGAPGSDSVYAYAYVSDTIEYLENITATGAISDFALSFVPDSIDAIDVSSETKQFLPYIDYTLSGATITFATAPAADTIVVRQRPGFRLISKMTGIAGTNFGFSVSTATDGAQLIVSAPLEDVGTVASAGAVYVYDRTIEAFKSGGDLTYSTRRTIGVESKVYINDILQPRRYTSAAEWTYEINSLGQVQFAVAPQISDEIKIETNAFNLLERKVASAPNKDAQLGYSVNLCPTNCSLYVGAPYHSDEYINSGAVYRFFNQGRTLGYVLGTVENPVVTSGDTLRINDYEVEFLSSNLDDVVAAINAKQIPGVTALNDGGYIRIDSNSLIARNRLRILAGQGTAISDLGIEVFPQVQMITNPYNSAGEQFGKKIRVTRTLPDTTLLIGSSVAATYETTTFDDGGTLFDRSSTNHKDRIEDSGAVYVYTYLNDARQTVNFPAGLLAFAQQLTPSNGTVSSGDQFGFDFDIQDNVILVGAPNESSIQTGSGQVYLFENPNRYLGWRLLREETPKVDINSINKFYLWSKSSNTIISTLDYIDPAKGKILGNAEQEITYKTVYDPATYNRGDNSSVTASDLRHWSDRQVGQVWWNLDAVRYLDYEQGSLQYRATNWGKTFPDSQIEVYEWVESLYLPSQYIANGGNGTPKHVDDSAYVAMTVIDSLTNQEYNKYYYWVKDKTTVESNQFGRSIPVSYVRDLIENPRGQNIKYVAAIQNDAVALFNCASAVVGTDTLLHIDFDRKLNTNIIHSEWELVGETAANGLDSIPTKIFNKIIDSLSGIDVFGNTVPDPLLPVQKRYGIEIRPRQSVFIDREMAMKTVVEHINAWFKTIPLSLAFDISTLSNKESVPPANSGAWDVLVPNIETLGFINPIVQPIGYKVLVETDSMVDNLWTIYVKSEGNTWELTRVQSYNDEPYWDYVDWYSDGYDASLVPNHTVNSNSELASLTIRDGDTVKIRNDGSGNFRIIKVTQTRSDTIALQNGTVKFNENLYKLADYGMGFGNDNYDVRRFDQNPSIELRNMLDVLLNRVLSGQYQSQYGKFLQLVIGYILTEQKYVDWVFKTSFVSVLHKMRKLDQPANYVRDSQDLYSDYLEEVKPYRTTMREYIVGVDGVDNVNGYVTDFDVPAYYDNVKGLYRGPSGEYYQDLVAVTSNPVYRDWMETYTYSIPTGTTSIVVVPTRPGKGYLTKPVVTITGSATGNNATAEAVFDYATGKITAINVTKAGYGYIGKDRELNPLTPTVTITGGSLPNSARDYSFGLTVQQGDFIKTSDLRYFTVLTDGVLTRQPEYNPAQAVGDVINAGASLEFIGEEALAYIRLENNTIRKIKTVLTFDRITYSSTVKLWAERTAYQTDDIVAYNNVAYRVISDFVSGTTFDGNKLAEYDTSNFTWAGGTNNANANDRIQAFYSPGDDAPGKSFDLLQAGIAYPGVSMQSPKFSDNPFFDSGAAFDSIGFDSFEVGPDGTIELNRSLLDTIVTSRYTDSFLTPTTDTRDDGIVVDGGGGVLNGNVAVSADVPHGFPLGGYVTTYTSHGPEELIPGRVFDTVDIQVYQAPSPAIIGNNEIVGSDIQFTSYAVENAFDTYAYGNGKQFNNALYVYSNLTGRLTPAIDYSIDYFAQTITMIKSLAIGDTVFIYAHSYSGTNEKNEVSYRGDGSQTLFSTHVSNAVDLSALILVDGVRNYNFSIVSGNNTQYIEFVSAPAADSYVHIIIFGGIDSTISEVHTQYHTVSRPGTSVVDYQLELDRNIGAIGPLESFLVVEVNKRRLRPPTNAYYVGDAIETEYALPVTDGEVAATSVLVEDLRVVVDGVEKTYGADFIFGTASVVFNTAPSDGAKIVIAVDTYASYRMVDANTMVITGTSISQNDVITIDSFSIHDRTGIETQVFVGGQTYTSQAPVGLDQLLFDDISGFDGTKNNITVVPRFDLGQEIANNNYVWASLDGRRLIPNYDFIIDGQYIYVSSKYTVTNSSQLVVTVFGNSPAIAPISFRQFRDVTGKVEYLRIALSGTTALAEDLLIGDASITVDDASKLPEPSADLAIPGVIMIDGERIQYYSINRETNTLGQIQRGTAGTGAKNHLRGARVDDASLQQLIPDSSDIYTLALFKDNYGGDGSQTTFIANVASVGFDLEAVNEQCINVYVGGTLLRNDSDVSEYTVDSMSPLTITLNTAPPAGSWVAFEIRTGVVWYDVDIVPVDPTGSGLANSTTNQATFVKKEPGFLP